MLNSFSGNEPPATIVANTGQLQKRLNMRDFGAPLAVAARQQHAALARQKDANPELVSVLEEYVRAAHQLTSPVITRYKVPDHEMQGDFETALSESASLRNLVKAEQVEPFTSLEDARTRLGVGAAGDRRTVFAWPDPYAEGALISVQVARTQGLQNSIQTVLTASETPSEQPDTAIFYSISNWKRLALPIGEQFILAVAAEVQRAHPEISNLSTLSPMPGFRKWIMNDMQQSVVDFSRGYAGLDPDVTLDQFRATIAAVTTPADLQATPGLSDQLEYIGVDYLAQGRRSPTIDPVAKFHLGNGAALGRVLVNADTSAKGMKQSLGVMANYFYNPRDVKMNRERFRFDYGIPASPEVAAIRYGTRGLVPRAHNTYAGALLTF